MFNFGQYNDARDGLGALLDTWQGQLEPLARTRPHGPKPGAEQAFKPEEPVLVGWGLNPKTKVSFLTAEDPRFCEGSGVQRLKEHGHRPRRWHQVDSLLGQSSGLFDFV